MVRVIYERDDKENRDIVTFTGEVYAMIDIYTAYGEVVMDTSGNRDIMGITRNNKDEI